MMLLSQAVQMMGGRLSGADVHFAAVSTDTRNIRQGDLFIALKGDNFDGAKFVPAAAQAGAVAAVVNADSVIENVLCPLVRVADTRLALGQLAAYWRKQFKITLVAITGSNGKTTVKEMLAAILRVAAGGEESVLATKGNFNNDIGMPLTLLRLCKAHRYAVIEMGMNHAGEIDYLSRIACPDVALVNNAAGVHLQGLGSVEAVAAAKGEIFFGLSGDGVAVINADDSYAALWRSLNPKHRVLDFSLENKSATVRGEWQAQGGVLKVYAPAGEVSVQLQVLGEHNARNALAATAVSIALNLPLSAIAKGLENFGGVSGRLQIKEAKCGATLIDDTYNANPPSVRAALAVLAQMRGQRIAVLGDMGELGDDAETLHGDVGAAARKLGIERLFLLGELSQATAREFGEGAQHFECAEDLCDELDKALNASTAVLVKGSRFMKMERVVDFCVADQEEICCSN